MSSKSAEIALMIADKILPPRFRRNVSFCSSESNEKHFLNMPLPLSFSPSEEIVRLLAVDFVIQLCRTRPTDAILADTIFIGTSSPFRHLNSRERAAVSC